MAAVVAGLVVATPTTAVAQPATVADNAAAMPRQRWPIFLVTPATLLRWHRELRLYARHRTTLPANGLHTKARTAAVADVLRRMVMP